MGGLPAGRIARDEQDAAPWERQVDALVTVLGRRKLVRVDELRRAIEELGADAYDRLSYYERWMAALTHLLLEKRVIAVGELGARMAEIETGKRSVPP